MPHLELIGVPSTHYPKGMTDKFVGHKLVIVGGAACVWKDLDSIGIRGGVENNGYDIMCVNDIVMHYPGLVRHFYSNDVKFMGNWINARREKISKQYGPIEFVHSCSYGCRYHWPWPGHGTSALGAAYCAIAMGFDSIVLCGVPLDNGPHYFDPPWKKTNFLNEVPYRTPEIRDNEFLKYWQPARDHIFNGKVKSCSGRTRKLLGFA